MPGRAPKPDALRARTNSESQSTELVANPDREVPDLPAIRDWQQTTRDFWATLWTSPQAEMWVASFMPGLLRLATTTDDYFRAETPEERRALSAELRQLEKSFGLNPEAAAKLRWILVEGEAAAKRSTSPSEPIAPVSDDRGILFES